MRLATSAVDDRPRATPCRRQGGSETGNSSRQSIPVITADRIGRRPQPIRSHLRATTNKRGGRSLCRPLQSREDILLQVGHRGQVSRELDDTGRAAPVGTCPERIVPGNGGGSDGSIESTREDAAITLRQVGV